jgi:hypothetical protein
LNDKEEVNAFKNDYKVFLPQDRKLIIIDDFSNNSETFDKLMSLMEGDFIVITKKDGGTGVDYKG